MWLATLVALALTAEVRTLAAQDMSSSEFRSNDYAIDLFTGPVLGSPRIVGMAGAYGAIATGIDGSMFNPVGYAERAEEEIDTWEWELTGGIWLGGLFSRNDVDNNGSRKLEAQDAFQFSLGGRLQIGSGGFGISLLSETYELDQSSGAHSELSFSTYRFGTAYAFMRGSLVGGVAARGISFSLSDANAPSEDDLVSFDGLGAEIGVLLRPAHQRYRASTVVRTPVSSRVESESKVMVVDGLRTVRGFVLPEEIRVPWEVDVGFAYQFGARRTNVPWRNPNQLKRELSEKLSKGLYVPPPSNGGPAYPPLPDDEAATLKVAMEHEREAARRYLRHQPRRYVLLSGDVLFSGRTARGQGVQAFVAQRREASGRKVSIGVRAGVESEVMENRLKLRGGSYLEPSRFARAHYRPHGTFGSDVRLFDLWEWSIRASATLDVAPRYFDWGLSVGLWH
jgi:hypothetical protein